MQAVTLGKWQWVRLVDIFFLGPFMMLLARELAQRAAVETWKSDLLYGSGVLTILFNLYFYIKIAMATAY
jgi:hypothetical protein